MVSCILYRAGSRFALSQWETVLLCDDVSHWQGASLESALLYILYIPHYLWYVITCPWYLLLPHYKSSYQVWCHYNDAIMRAMAFQITSITIVYSNVYSTHISKKTSKLCVTGLCEENSPVTGEFPAQRATNAENVSIWWRHQFERSRYRVLKTAVCDWFCKICHQIDESHFVVYSKSYGPYRQ